MSVVVGDAEQWWDLLADRWATTPAPGAETSDIVVAAASFADLLDQLGSTPGPERSAPLTAAVATVATRYSGLTHWSVDLGPVRVEIDIDLEEGFGHLRDRTAALHPIAAESPGQLAVVGDEVLLRYRVGETSATPVGAMAARATAFLGHVRTLLAAGLADPERPVGRLELATPDELSALAAANDEPADDGGETDDATLVTLIAQQVAAAPDAVAVRCDGAHLTYRELWETAGVVAAELRRRGVGGGSLVGVWCQRRPELLASLVGVLRSGAAYVALEPNYPTARLARVAGHAQLPVVVTATADAPEVAARLSLGVLTVGPPPTGSDPVTADGVDPGAADLAYVMYTSGSTGEPKGVMVSHGNVVNLLRHMAIEPGLGRGEVMLGVTTPAFDLSVPDLFLPLITGGTLELATADVARDPRALGALLTTADAALMQATPSTWRMLVDSGWAGSSGLRIVCGGEGYDAELVRALSRRSHGVWNFYGPTETTVWSVSTRLTAEQTDPIPIGRPMRRTACFVLDEHGQRTPPGVRGELYIAGAGVARGYLHDPQRTAERFCTADPDLRFGRMYRTGDVVRQAADGTLTFLGRADNQVKLRGYRIELGEIESALAALDGVGQAVCLVSDGTGSDDGRLFAYAVPAVASQGSALDPAELRRQLAALLPPQMVPASVTLLDELPLSANGKIDRRALLALSTTPAASTETDGRDASADDSSPLQQLVVQTWRSVLGAGVGVEVRPDDSFFALGAHSLDVGRVAVRLSDELGLDVPLGLLFRHPTMGELALALLVLLAEQDSGELDAVLGAGAG